jgi:hypothetical protein
LKRSYCPKAPQRKIPRDIDEDARDVTRALAGTEAAEQSRHERKKVEMLFAHLKRILKLGRLRLRGPYGAQNEFLLAATAQNLRKLAKLVWKPPKAAECGGKGDQRASPEINKPKPTQPDRCQLQLLQQNLP